MSRGVFVVVEGPEGAGKSTLAAALATRMRAHGLDVVQVREPGGTPAAERAREALLDPAVHFEPNTELLFMTAARAHLVQAVIRPALETGQVVLSDRYDLSTLAYQGAGRGVAAETVRQVNDVATGGLRPDVTLVLDVAPDEGRRRLAALGKGTDRFEREDADFHARVRTAYRSATGEGIVHLVPAGAGELADAAWAALVSARPATFGDRKG